ncbi:MAG: hypothetical protein ABI946_10040, partial [Chthoniobacterales bacterium]
MRASQGAAFSRTPQGDSEIAAPCPRDAELEATARALLCATDAITLAPLIRVEWNRSVRTAAGRADF